jgi:iron-sulfur cluster assembly protein
MSFTTLGGAPKKKPTQLGQATTPAAEPSPATTPVPDVPRDEILVTPLAAQKIVELAAREGQTDAFLRVGIQGGGCSGLSYTFSFTAQPDARDKVFTAHGAKVCIDPKSLLYLGGSVLEWKESLMKSGFVFQNPHETKSCSCGDSFSV